MSHLRVTFENWKEGWPFTFKSQLPTWNPKQIIALKQHKKPAWQIQNNEKYKPIANINSTQPFPEFIWGWLICFFSFKVTSMIIRVKELNTAQSLTKLAIAFSLNSDSFTSENTSYFLEKGTPSSLEYMVCRDPESLQR